MSASRCLRRAFACASASMRAHGSRAASASSRIAADATAVVTTSSALCARANASLGASARRMRAMYSTMSTTTAERTRNVAVIAHVDHGKTTLMDALMKRASGGASSDERAMDSRSLEKERGITISAKYTSLHFELEGSGGYVVNAVDTPGHADFGGEVERALDMVDGCLLLIDPSEGVMAQTKFVLRKALKKGLKPIVVFNKVDRDGVTEASCAKVETEVFDLMAALGANDEQLDFPVAYASARAGAASSISVNDAQRQIIENRASVDAILRLVCDRVPPPSGDANEPFSMLVSMIDRDPFLGRVVTGRVVNGSLKVGDRINALKLADGSVRETARVQKIFTSKSLSRVEIDRCVSGDIVTIAGFSGATVTDTLCDVSVVDPLASTPIDPPTLRMMFSVNDSSLAGKEGKQLTERQIEERLRAEAETDVALRVEPQAGRGIEVQGRGELHLGVLIETMRREGFELSVSPPTVIYATDEDGRKTEPLEELILEVDANDVGTVIEAVTHRKGELSDMEPNAGEEGRTRLVFVAPSRGLIGFRQDFINATRGTGLMQRAFHSYGAARGKMDKVRKGMLISTTSGVTTTYALGALEPRGTLFVGPAEEVYEGMIIGEHSRENNLEVNPTKEKKLTNVRADGKDDTVRLTPPKAINLEEAIGYVAEDELIEVTPKVIRLRKAETSSSMRRRNSRHASA
ncbi:putative GTPase [Ostreococcus tauri]|nr:putative GTPase [Ostreococcus tauri]